MSEYKYQLDLQSKITYAKREGRQEILNLLKSGKSAEEIINIPRRRAAGYEALATNQRL
jgi:hypothetical protein